MADSRSAALRPTLEHRIGGDDTDHLGHMNIRRYAELAEAGVPRLLDLVGVDEAYLDTHEQVAVLVDVYTRHHREQWKGSVLTLHAGVLDVDDRRLRMYAELRNDDRDELAAAFVQTIGLFYVVDRSPAAMPVDAVETARQLTVDWPAQGRPR